ncbi:MAG TPA: sigma-70 family RNA polymerase sigma factor [Anaerolineales bacterium]|nr:sigma-70 family RNA polymerase sigma factor [Anaerolineales bacterium]
MKQIQTDEQAEHLASALAGDQGAFEKLVEPYRREILVHCYRILGSFEDAEDISQEILLRVWKRLESFEGRSSLRAWLYKIATNACLDALDSRRARGLSKELYPRGDPTGELPSPSNEVIWVEPFPDEYIDGQPNIYPEARYEVRESITLAFVAALQKLPGRQRAALLLCDVLGWSANEAAEILDSSTAAVNSALQRARETMKQPERKPISASLNEQLSALLSRYVSAWEAADSAALVAVLREDVALTMPPLPVWFGGRDNVYRFIEEKLFKMFDPFRVRLIPIRANSSPAFAAYQMDSNGDYRAAAIHILTIENGEITEINDFLTFDGQLFSKFGLPLMI